MVRDSILKEQQRQDSIKRAAFVRDSLERVAFVEDSIRKVDSLYNDSVARFSFKILNIYPIPFENLLTIELYQSGGSIWLSILNINGQEIETIEAAK
jgi:hypothetical protein